jgi:galactokinase
VNLPASTLAGMLSTLGAWFEASFGRPPAYVGRAPGRVNLIGEHTDYNAGLCLPIALAQSAYAAVGPRDDALVRVVSAQRVGSWEGEAAEATGWAGYAAGVVWALRAAGVDVPGVDIAVDSAVPQGAGLSSSAALECAVAVAVSGLVGGIDPSVIVAAAMRAEAEIVGAPTGGMDQTIAMYAEPGHALLIDFADGSRRPVPWAPEDLSVVVVNTGVTHDLADGAYAARRKDCEMACAELGIGSLRELGAAALSDGAAALSDGDEPWRSRARHVTSENQRVESFVTAVTKRDWTSAGALMTASHLSLRDDFEVSCVELDTVVDVALAQGALGARMTGGGFGGSAIALVADDRVNAVTTAIGTDFLQRGWRPPTFLTAEASGAAGLVG